MIDQIGKTIHPKHSIGIGIAGVIPITVGIQDANVILAINKDPQAALLQTADLDALADYKAIVPLLIEELNKGASFSKRDLA